MMPESSGEPDPTIISSLADGGLPRTDPVGMPVKPPSMAISYLVMAGCLACAGIAVWMTALCYLHHARPHLWYLGMLAGLLSIGGHAATDNPNLGKPTRIMVFVIMGVGVLCALQLLAYGQHLAPEVGVGRLVLAARTRCG